MTTSGVMIDRDAVVRGGNGETIVWRHTEPEYFEARPVRTEPFDATHVLVAAGIGDGERIVDPRRRADQPGPVGKAPVFNRLVSASLRHRSDRSRRGVDPHRLRVASSFPAFPSMCSRTSTGRS